jgi:hypothetical protein
MSYHHATGIQRGKSELCVSYSDWPVSREAIEVGFFDAAQPMITLTREEAKKLTAVLQEMSKDPLNKQERERLVREIEALTPDQIRQRLADNGIEEGGDLAQYSKAKKVIFQGLWLNDSKIYERHLQVIVDYLDL